MDPSRLAVSLLAAMLVASGAVAGTTNAIPIDGDSVPAIDEVRAGSHPFDADTDGDGLDDGAERVAGADARTADTDGDGLDDGPEVHEHGTDPTAVDTDGDGAGDRAELDEHGTEPTRRDTDDDGLADGVELEAHGSDPTAPDTDADGLDDRREVADLDTDPTSPDSDGDGLGDGPEVDRHGTDPTAADTDGDRLADGPEVADHGTDPTLTDTDGDGLNAGREVSAYASAPTAADTDGDGLDDRREVGTLDTNPLRSDTDADRLADDVEVTDLGTDPTDRDTDGDGLRDGLEAADDGPLSAGDPRRMDEFVEVDAMTGKAPPRASFSAVGAAFANAPVENPDGSMGITLHVVVDDTIPLEPRTEPADRDRLRRAHFDHFAQGYHYAVAVSDARHDGRNVGGFGRPGSFVFQTETPSGSLRYSSGIAASIFMHELGHSLGLSSSDYTGIDSRSVPHLEYPSVMNFNAPSAYVSYHDDEPFDDWEQLETNLFTPSTFDAAT